VGFGHLPHAAGFEQLEGRRWNSGYVKETNIAEKLGGILTLDWRESSQDFNRFGKKIGWLMAVVARRPVTTLAFKNVVLFARRKTEYRRNRDFATSVAFELEEVRGHSVGYNSKILIILVFFATGFVFSVSAKHKIP
jgi:hypothetical protein